MYITESAAGITVPLTITGVLSATGGNSTQWNTAYGWGNHAGLYLPIGGKAADSELLDGYNLDGATSVATRIFNNKGQVHGTYTDFNTAMTPGPNYIQAGTNGPTGTASQWYGFMLGLGSDYNTETGNASSYASQLYWNRQSNGGFPYLYARDMETGTWGSWRKMSAGYADTAGSASSVAWGNISSIPSLWYQSGSWYADFASYSFVRENGVSMSGGSEFVLMSRSGQGHVLIDGSYWAGEGSGFYSLNSSNQYTSQVGFARDSNAFAAFNTTVSAVNDVRAPIFYDSNNTGYYVDAASTSNLNILTLSGNGYFRPNSWIQFDGDYGIFSATVNGAHFRPNHSTYGSWEVLGSRAGWQGLQFSSGSNGAVTQMISTDSNTVGFHNNSYGWQIRWANGTMYVGKNSYGGNEATVLDTSNAPRGGYSNLMYYQGFTLDANTMNTNSTGFTYSVNAPYTGPVVRFSTGGGYDLWLNYPYGGNGYGLAFRTRNGDSASLNSWQYPAVYGVNANGGG